MYVDKYINDFDLEMYNCYLSDTNKLRALADSYVNQYDNPSYDCTIAFKESLDHYIFKQLKENPSFKTTSLFSNYLHYINYIFSRRSNNGFQLEYNTNILFQNRETRQIILSFYKDDVKDKLLNIIKNNENVIDTLFRKMNSCEILNISELNLIADYLYTRRDLTDNRYFLFVDYLLNITINYEVSPYIVAALISYLPQLFGDGCENSRVILSNGIYKSDDIQSILPSDIDNYRDRKKLKHFKLYSFSDKYISMDWDILKDIDLNSDKSLNISRTMSFKDIYWLVMVTFHELTHQLANRSMFLNEFNSSGFAQLIKIAKRDPKDFRINHDSIETEIEADENAWRKMFHFILKFRSNTRFFINKSVVHSQIEKCIVNEKSVYARRSIQTKYNVDDRFFASDMRYIQSLFKKSSKYRAYFRMLLGKYPMMNMVFDSQANIKISIMFDNNLTSKNSVGNDENIMGCELSNYILNEGYHSLKKFVIKYNLSKQQIQNLLMNIYNTYHLEKKYINSLSKLDFSQLEETHTNFDYNNPVSLRKKYLEKFKNIADLVYKERELITIIKRKYPEYEIEKLFPPKYAMWNYIDMFNHLYDISSSQIDGNDLQDIVSRFEESGDFVLKKLANFTISSIEISSYDAKK